MPLSSQQRLPLEKVGQSCGKYIPGCRFYGEPEVEHTLITMPDTHASIVRLVQQTCTDILCSTPGANRAVAPADPFDNAMLDKAMTSAAELERSVPGSQRMLLKAYSSIAVLRCTICISRPVCICVQLSYLIMTVLLQHTLTSLCQTARLSTCISHVSRRSPCKCMAGHAIAAEHAFPLCRQCGRLLLSYGVRCAHLHLKHCMQELPGLYTACREVVAALQQAYERVDTGHLQDHPKLAALRAVLTTVSVIQPVSCHLTACSFGDIHTQPE